MTPEDFLIARQLADKLMATNHPSEFWDDLDALTPVRCEALDTIVFECSAYSRWHPIAQLRERDSRWFCIACAEFETTMGMHSLTNVPAKADDEKLEIISIVEGENITFAVAEKGGRRAGPR